jgi:hypothetical protein
MTKRLGYQKDVFNKEELMKYFESSNYEDCRINAYPSFTNYQGINRRKHADFVPLLDFIIKRLCYTLTYLVTKTSFYLKIQSLKEDMFSASIIPCELTKELFATMEAYRELEEDL